ncbi:ParA family protein [Marinibactrum halimedae]|nr:ParA family protein [Marinibactrum halimedae]MCD9459923.1 ParA family protein [Marinibactrum halimedae]
MTTRSPQDKASGSTSTVRVISRPKATRIMIANGKGGVGKTTVTTNLLSHLSLLGPVGLFDYDTQGSASFWLSLRGEREPVITRFSTKAHDRGQVTRSWMTHQVAQKARYVVTDTPAGLSSPLLDKLLIDTDIVLIPVSPSQIDIHATAAFVKSLLLNPQFRRRPVKLGVVMNRIRKNTLSFHKLEKFLSTLDIPVVSQVRDTQFYVKAAEAGLGVNELSQKSPADQKSWVQMIRWIRAYESTVPKAADRSSTQKKLRDGTEQLLGVPFSDDEPVEDQGQKKG